MLGVAISSSVGNAKKAITPEIKPLGKILSSCEFDMDATIAASYSGSGEDFDNYEASPASGASQSDYDLFLGATSTPAEGDEPTFNGSAGDSAAYFSFDGGDFFKAQGANTQFLEDIHDTVESQDFTMVMPLYYVSGNEILMTNRLGGGANIGVMMYILAATDSLYFTQRGAIGNATDNSTATLNVNAVNFVALGYDHDAEEVTFWINTSIGQTKSLSLNLTAAAASGVLSIGAYSSGISAMVNGSRVYGASMFNKKLTNAEMLKVIRQYELRHDRNYI